MDHKKFEVNGSLRDNVNATEALLLTNRELTLTWSELVEAACLLKHKTGLNEKQCVGFKISENQVIFLFER